MALSHQYLSFELLVIFVSVVVIGHSIDPKEKRGNYLQSVLADFSLIYLASSIIANNFV